MNNFGQILLISSILGSIFPAMASAPAGQGAISASHSNPGNNKKLRSIHEINDDIKKIQEDFRNNIEKEYPELKGTTLQALVSKLQQEDEINRKKIEEKIKVENRVYLKLGSQYIEAEDQLEIILPQIEKLKTIPSKNDEQVARLKDLEKKRKEFEATSNRNLGPMGFCEFDNDDILLFDQRKKIRSLKQMTTKLKSLTEEYKQPESQKIKAKEKKHPAIPSLNKIKDDNCDPSDSYESSASLGPEREGAGEVAGPVRKKGAKK